VARGAAKVSTIVWLASVTLGEPQMLVAWLYERVA
jgi:hypothetical protein